MRTCPKCREEKSLDRFNRNKSRADGLQVWCRDCKNALTHAHYLRNKEAYHAKARNREKEFRQWFIEYKSTLKCNRCSENHIAALDFHHLSGKDKAISAAIHQGWSVERTKAELPSEASLFSRKLWGE